MKQYQTFIFDSYEWDELRGTIELRYSLDGEVNFTETITLPHRDAFARNGHPDPAELDAALAALHMIGGISYYKTCLPKKIDILSCTLTKEETEFWKMVYENGLGEFFYKNNVEFENLISFPADAMSRMPPDEAPKAKRPRVLTPIGGGKDSMVTIELLRAGRIDQTLFRLGAHKFIDELADIAGLPLLTVKRGLSKELFELNEQGALNGHVPITAYLSCVCIVLALLYDFDAVALSSERSADEGNMEYRGKMINHQWSKSLEFERAFQAYLKRYVTQKVEYFSMLRPLSELKIGELFTKKVEYLKHFTSCNANWKIAGHKPETRWCGVCSKCAFAYALIAAFLPKEKLVEIFGSDFFARPELQAFYRQLLGLEGFKPFECVGTPEETSAAFLLAHRRGDLEDSAAMKTFVADVLPGLKDPDGLIKRTLAFSKDHAVPEPYRSLLP